MKVLRPCLFAVCSAVLCSAVLAAPPPACDGCRPAHDDAVPGWRTLSSRVIEMVFGIGGRRRHGLSSAQHGPKSEIQLPALALERYRQDLVLRFNVTTDDEAASLAEAADTLLLDVWEFAEDWVDVRLTTDEVPLLLGLLPPGLQNSHAPLLREKALAEAIFDNYHQKQSSSFPIASSAAASSPHLPAQIPLFDAGLQPATGAGSNAFFADYQPLTVIEPWLRLLASLFDTHVRLISIGRSSEGREIFALRVGARPASPNPDAPPRKTILVTGGAHAREWISTATVDYIAYSLITGYGTSSAITSLLEAFDFIFIPTLNPDGYAYTWEADRLWRKSRQPTGTRFCRGIDLDRSFGFAWSPAPEHACSESYPGDSPFESVEAAQLARWTLSELASGQTEFVGLLDLHAYSQRVLYPYAFSCETHPPARETLQELAFGIAKAMRGAPEGKSYAVASACAGNLALQSRIEPAGGSLLDHFHAVLGVRYALQVKLRDRGSYGFLLPRAEIVPTGREALAAVVYFAEFLRESDADGVQEEIEEEGDGVVGSKRSEETVMTLAGERGDDVYYYDYEHEHDRPDETPAEHERREDGSSSSSSS